MSWVLPAPIAMCSGPSVAVPEEVRLESRQLLAALGVAEGRRVSAAPVERGAVGDRIEIGLPQRLRRRMIHPSAAERDHLVRIEPEREDGLALGHLHDVADRGWASHLLAHQP